MSIQYDYNFASRVNRAYGLYPERLTSLIKEVVQNGTDFQRAYIEALSKYAKTQGRDIDVSGVNGQKLPEMVLPDMVTKGFCADDAIKEFSDYNLYVTRVGWP